MTKGRSLGILLCLGIFLPALAAGQPASLLLDINTTGLGSSSETFFFDLQKAGDRLYFIGGGKLTGEEIWVSDGTSAGTEVIRDLCPGPCSNDPILLGAYGKLMIWADLTGLWRSDGTRPGTFVLTPPGLEIGPKGHPDGYFLYATLGRWFYFSACTGYNVDQDCDLWRTDGTVAGTGIFHKASKTFRWFQVVGDRLYFLAGDYQTNGSDLWVTDGTPGGTVLLRRFEGGQPEVPAAAGNRLFFAAVTDGGRQVWTSDGTAAGTRAVTNFPSFSEMRWFKPVGSRVYFLADDGSHGLEIWRSDGTPTGTTRLTDLAPAVPFPVDDPSILAELGGVVVFVTPNEDPTKPELWITRGSPGSTAPLSCEGCRPVYPYRLTESGGRAFFLVQQNSEFRIDLWLTDGTSPGTRRVKNLCSSCSLGQLVPWKGGVLFSSSYVEDLWISDGTAAGTRPFTHLVDAEVFAHPPEVAEIDGDVYFLAISFARGERAGLWVRDRQGKTRPVFIVPVSGPTSDPRNLVEAGGKLLFAAQGDQTAGLWSSAGTQESTVRLLVPGLDDDFSDFIHAAGVVFFQGYDIYGEPSLWRTDGTAQGTIKLLDLPDRAILVPYQGALYAFSRREVWRSNGTAAGTVKVGDLPDPVLQVEIAMPGPNGIYLKIRTSSFPSELWLMDGAPEDAHRFFDPDLSAEDPRLTAVGPWMYFTYSGQVWRTDGTPGNTTVVEGLPRTNILELVSHQGALYFLTLGGPLDGDYRLWRTEDTTAELIARFSPRYPGNVSSLTPFGGKIFFSAGDGIHGIELWATDGTSAGTALVRDLMPGPISSSPSWLTVADGRLFFTAGDDLHGIELWQSDGTAAGTRLVQDIAPQAESSSPEQLTPVGDKLFFTADDGVTGREVWVLPLSGSSSCKPSPTRLCLGGGRYAVEAVWRDFQGNRGVGHAAPLTADTGTFWFFDPANVEVVLKVLDGRGVNGHEWVFYGALSNVEYTLTVTDTQTGLSHRYLNPSGQLASVADTKAFGPLGATTEQSVAAASPLPLVERRAGPATAVCAPSSTRLCLNQDRFAVEIAWKDFEGKTGVGKAVEMTGDTGYFWFFNESNV
ncbi:MAG TPA: ELWxxDGT repeat protein, partial [Thermoanaerobaculia bacterium]|nr:ELWxxDGT repeat protein [Thermoanaerobaculia bacterium]